MFLLRLILVAAVAASAACAQLPDPPADTDVRSGPKVGPGNPKSRGHAG